MAVALDGDVSDELADPAAGQASRVGPGVMPGTLLVRPYAGRSGCRQRAAELLATSRTPLSSEHKIQDSLPTVVW